MLGYKEVFKMFCSKCGSQIPEGSKFCTLCGTQVAGEGYPLPPEQEPGNRPAAWPSPDYRRVPGSPLSVTMDGPAKLFIVFGALFMALGAFLPWIQEEGVTLLGVNVPLGGTATVLCLVAVMQVCAVVLSRSGAIGAWNYVFLLLSLVAMALVFQFLYFVFDNEGGASDLSYGYWMTMSGTLVATVGSILGQWGAHRR